MTATAKIRLFQATLEQREECPHPAIMVRVVDRDGNGWATPSLSEGLAHLLSNKGAMLELWEIPPSNLPPDPLAEDAHAELVNRAAIVSIGCDREHSKLFYSFELPYDLSRLPPDGEPIDFAEPGSDVGLPDGSPLNTITVELDHPSSYEMNSDAKVPFLNPDRFA